MRRDTYPRCCKVKKTRVLLAVLEHGRVSPGFRPPRSRILASSQCCGKGVWMQNSSFHVDCGCIPSPKTPGSCGWAAGTDEGAEPASPGRSSPARARCGQRVLRQSSAGGLFLCRGSAGSPSRGGEHPPRSRNFLHCDIFSETQSKVEGSGRQKAD